MSMLRNITAGNPRSLIKPVFYTTIANLAGIVPFVLLMEAVRLIFAPYAFPGEPLDTTRLWWVCGGMALSLLLMYGCEIPAYRSSFAARTVQRRKAGRVLRSICASCRSVI